MAAAITIHTLRVLAQRWPGVPNLGDVTTADFSQVQADAIAAGFPCQDLSNAGKRAGLAGKRSGLFWEVVRAVRMVRPRVVLLENVAALLQRGMGTVLGALPRSVMMRSQIAYQLPVMPARQDRTSLLLRLRE